VAFIPGVSDILDADGNSLIVRNPDGSVPVTNLQLGTGLSGSWSKDGATGIVTVAPDPDAIVSASALAFGSGYAAQGGPFQQGMPGSGGSPVQLGPGWTVNSGAMLTLRSKISIRAFGPVMMWAYLETIATFVNAGAGVKLASSALGPGSTSVPPLDGVLGLNPSGSTVMATVSPLSIPAWAPSTAYVGSLVSGTSVPNGIMHPATGCSLVTNAGNIYVCWGGGTSASSGGPTATGLSITDGGATWAFTGATATAGLPFTWTLHEFEVLTA